MAKVLDLRNCGGQLVILGDSIAVPTSNSSTFAMTSPRVAGSLRYNPDSNRIEYLSKNSLDWLSIGGVGEDDLSSYLLKAGDSMSGNLVMTGTARFRGIDGTAGSPSFTFASATSTGFALSAGSIVTSIGGTARVTVGTASTNFNNKIVAQDGTVSAPGICFNSSADSGLFYSNGAIGLANNGVNILQFTDTAYLWGVSLVPTVDASFDLGTSAFRWRRVFLADGAAGTTSLVFGTSGNTGLFGNATQVNTSVSGTRRLQITANDAIFSTNIGPVAHNTYSIGNADVRFAAMYAMTFDGQATSARYADLAERYEADAEYEIGTVVVIGGDKEITISTQDCDPAVAGIISANPGFRLNEGAGEDATHPFVALRGRVPCRVVGPVKKGSLLVTSETPGHARQATGVLFAGVMIGKALESFDGDFGVIEVLV